MPRFGICLYAWLAVLLPLAADAISADPRPVNVLFLMTDQHHFASLGCAGNPTVKTPNLDRLAADGARFTEAFCVTPYCSPTRAALVTGRYPCSFGLGRNVAIGPRAGRDELRLHEPCDTYLHHLATLGYHCHQLGKWHLGVPSQLSCFPEGDQDVDLPAQMTVNRQHAAGSGGFEGDAKRPGEVERVGDDQTGPVYLRSESAKPHRELLEARKDLVKNRDNTIIGRAVLKPELWYESVLADYCIDLIKRHRNEPFAITYSVSPPHNPFIAPVPYYDLYDPKLLPLPATWNDHPREFLKSFSAGMGATYGEAGFREYLRCYYARVTMMDACIGRILDAIDQLGLRDRTLVVFTSDHGNMLGQHGMMEKSTEALYDDLMRVPLIMRLPGQIRAGTICDSSASSVDVPVTILDYLAAPKLDKAHGRSLRPFLQGSPADDRPVFGERGELGTPGMVRMIRTPQWKFCTSVQPRKNLPPQLYDLQHDPDETHNLAAEPAQQQLLSRLKEQLRDHMQTVGDQALPHFTN